MTTCSVTKKIRTALNAEVDGSCVESIFESVVDRICGTSDNLNELVARDTLRKCIAEVEELGTSRASAAEKNRKTLWRM